MDFSKMAQHELFEVLKSNSEIPYTYRPTSNVRRSLVQQAERQASTEDYIQCEYCGYYAHELSLHISLCHGGKDAVDNYKGKKFSDSAFKKKSDRLKGENNPAYNHGGKLSPFSKKFVAYDGLTDEQKENAIGHVAKNAQDTRDENGTNVTSIEYWLKFTDGDIEEAKRLLSERQSTFSLDKCIEKYGREEGHIIWKNRQEKWLDTLDSKTDEEKEEILHKKLSGLEYSDLRSKLEIKFTEALKKYDSSLKIDEQVKFTADGKKFYFIDLVVDGKVAIEVNGDRWHFNPKYHKEDDRFNMMRQNKTAKEVWEYDAKKIAALESCGYTVIVVWEDDIKNISKLNKTIKEVYGKILEVI